MGFAGAGVEGEMDLTPADLKNPCDYGTTDESTGEPPTANFWDAAYQPTENIDDIPLSTTE